VVAAGGRDGRGVAGDSALTADEFAFDGTWWGHHENAVASGVQKHSDISRSHPRDRGTNPETLAITGGRLSMQTNGVTSLIASVGGLAATASVDAQKVVIVNGGPEMLETIETVLDAGHYDIVFVESSERAYSQIKRVQPNLVILCVGISDLDGFQVLSMLKLDEETRTIPVLTYTTEFEGDRAEDEEEEDAEPPQLFARPIVPRMN
jgi:CheY-like chemotaxis protein